MTKYAAIQAFFSGFGLSAFPAYAVPTSGDEKPDFPYITYSVPTASDGDEVAGTVNLWYRGESMVPINAKTEEIARAIGNEHRLECDGGGIIIRKGTPFAQPMNDDSDNMIRRKVLNLAFKYYTTV